MTSPDSARPTLIEAGLNFSAFGYFTHPLAQNRPPQVAPARLEHWLQLEALIRRLQAGDVDAAALVLALCRQSRDWALRTVATRVLGHAAPPDCFRDMRRELDALALGTRDHIDVETRELVLLYCRAFGAWGRLDVVPALLDYYLTLRLRKTPEISLIPLLIGQLIVGKPASMIPLEPPEDQLDEYLNLVMGECEDLAARLGSEKALVFRGALQSVRGYAERMRQLDSRYPAVDLALLRERFEPATGIDSGAIFAGKSVSTLAAAAIAEAFLESPESARYEPGHRYFFGREIPGE